MNESKRKFRLEVGKPYTIYYDLDGLEQVIDGEFIKQTPSGMLVFFCEGTEDKYFQLDEIKNIHRKRTNPGPGSGFKQKMGKPTGKYPLTETVLRPDGVTTRVSKEEAEVLCRSFGWKNLTATIPMTEGTINGE